MNGLCGATLERSSDEFASLRAKLTDIGHHLDLIFWKMRAAGIEEEDIRPALKALRETLDFAWEGK